MLIGELAKVVGCEVETIRFYEKEGLLDKPSRTASGYRSYSPVQLEQLKFVVHCRSLDISVAEIKRLLALKANPDLACNEINLLIDGHLDQIHRQIDNLRQLEQQLTLLRQHCHENLSVKECGIMKGLVVAAETGFVSLP